MTRAYRRPAAAPLARVTPALSGVAGHGNSRRQDEKHTGQPVPAATASRGRRGGRRGRSPEGRGRLRAMLRPRRRATGWLRPGRGRGRHAGNSGGRWGSRSGQSPTKARGAALAEAVGEALAHVVRQKVRPVPDKLPDAGRTRPIIRAQSPIDADAPNRAIALGNETMGWMPAGLALKGGAGRSALPHGSACARSTPEPSPASAAAGRGRLLPARRTTPRAAPDQPAAAADAG